MDSDGVEESFDGMVRVAVTAGARFGENMARLREQVARSHEARSLQESRELQARFDAERQAAVGELRNVHRSDWWDNAQPHDIGRTYATALAWEGHESEAATARNRIENELRTRYGVDVTDLDADPTQVQEHLARMEAERLEGLAAEARRKEAQDRAEADTLLRESDRFDGAAERSALAAEFEPDPLEHEQAPVTADRLRDHAERTKADSGVSYDSAERHSAEAASLEGQGFSERAIEARNTAAVSQAKPATEAVKQGKAAKARKGRPRAGRGKQATLDR